MSTLVDVPACLFAVLSLAASGADATRLGEVAQVPVEARDETAGGPYLLSDALWLPAWKAAETLPGLALPEAPRVYVTSSGHYYAPGEGSREKLLALRSDAEIAKRVAFAFAKRNAGRLEVALGRPAQPADLYMAHIFGAETAASFITLAADRPAAALSSVLPEVARLAPELAHEGKGMATVSRAYQRLTAAFEAARPAGFVLANAPPAVPSRLSLIEGVGAELGVAIGADAPEHSPAAVPAATSVSRAWSANIVAATGN